MTTSLARKSVPILPLEELRPSPLNPRKTFRKLDELAASIREVGILQPLLIRPLRADRQVVGYEVVAGERRRRAAELIGLAEVPVNLRELTDDEVVDLMLVENDQREDVHPLEQADAYAAQVARGRTVAEIAARTGRSESYVRHRLQLTTLFLGLRYALEAEVLTLTGALAAASLGPDDQLKLYNDLAQDCDWPFFPEDDGPDPAEDFRAEWDGWDGRSRGPILVGVGEVRGHLRGHALDLDRALFALDDAELLPAAGACTRCPKRTGAQVDLFGETDRDRCLDRQCFERKQDAEWLRKSTAARAAGLRVLEGADAQKLAPHGRLRYGDPDLVDLHAGSGVFDGIEEDDDARELTYRELLARAGLAEPPVTLLRSGDTILELTDRSVLQGVIAQAEPEAARELQHEGARSKPAEDDWKKRQQAAEAKAKVDADAKRRVIRAIVEAAVRESPKTQETRVALVEAAVHVVHEQVRKDVIKARYWKIEKVDGDRFASEHCIAREARDLDPAQVVGLLVELLATAAGEYSTDWAKPARPIGRLAAALNVSIEHHQREAKKAAGEKTKARRSKGKAKTKRKTKANYAEDVPGVCRECGCTEEDACDEGCVWVDASKTLCSNCVGDDGADE